MSETPRQASHPNGEQRGKIELTEGIVSFDLVRFQVFRKAVEEIRDTYKDRSEWPASGLTTSDVRGHKSAKRVYALVAKELTELLDAL